MLKLRFAFVATVMLVGGTAAADKIVLESYTGPRPADAEKILSPLLDELRRQHFTFGADNVGRQFDADVSRPATLQGLPRDFAAQVDAGHKAYVSGSFVDAEKILGPLVDLAHQNSGAFAADNAPRDALLKALIDLALSQQRKGDPGPAKETFEEVVRSFPGAAVSRAQYGPDAFTLFDGVQKALHAGTMGTLHVKVGNAAIYINEKLEGVGDVTKQVVPGEYRVFAQTMSKDLSRVHRVKVAGGADFEIRIDPSLDTAIHSGPQWTGLTFATAVDREKSEGAAAAAFARGLHAESVAIVSIDQVRGRPAIVGALVDLEKGHDIRRASVPVDSAASGAKSLASYLSGGPAGPGVDVDDVRQPKPDAKPDDAKKPDDKTDEDEHHDDRPPRGGGGSGFWGGYKYVAGGFALAALGTGGVLLVLDGRCQTPAPMGMQCTDVYSTATPGYIAIGGGVVLAAVTVVLALHGSNSSSPPARVAYIVPTQGGAFAGFSSSF